MNYNSSGHTGVKTFCVRDFKGGVNLLDIPSNTSRDQLTECENIWHNNGMLRTRPGLCTKQEFLIDSSDTSQDNINSYFMTETEFYLNDKKVKIAVGESSDWTSTLLSHIYFLGADGSITEAGSINFDRASDNEFYTPQNYLFLTGSHGTGGGVYAFITTRDRYNANNQNYKIYEIDSDMNGWTEVTNFYTPIVSINGRGTKYEEAKAVNTAYTEAPLMLESPNILTGSFYSYFTSDTYSSCFRLPFANLSQNSGLSCRIYSSPTLYTDWSIGANESTAKQNFYSVEVTLHFDRAKGIIYFTSADGDYPIPAMSMYHANNIQVCAVKKSDDGIKNIVSCKCVSKLGSAIVIACGDKKGKVYTSDITNPLYFPEASEYQIGDEDSNITSLLSSDTCIYAFKINKTYCLSINFGKYLSDRSLLADNDKLFKKSSTVEAQLISGDQGCANRRTTVMCGRNPVFLGSDGKVYTIASNKEINCLSEIISPYLESLGSDGLSACFAINSDGYYILISGRKAAIMEYVPGQIKCPQSGEVKTMSQGVKWYLWKFDERLSLSGGISEGEKTALMCCNQNICFLAMLGGSKDSVLTRDNDEYILTEAKIKSRITTSHFDLDCFSSKKSVQSVFLMMASSDSIDVQVNGGKPQTIKCMTSGYSTEDSELCTVRLVPLLRPSNTFYVTLESDNGIAFLSMSLYYTLL